MHLVVSYNKLEIIV